MNRTIFALCGALIAASLSACGANPTYIVTAPSATPTPFNSSTSSSMTAGTPMAFPSANGFSGSMTFPTGSTIPSGTTVQIALTQTAPAGATALQFRRMTSAPATLFYITLTPSATVSILAGATFSATVPTALAPAGTSFFIDCYQTQTQQWNECAGPSTASSSGVVNFTFGSAFSMNANTASYLALESSSSGTVIIQGKGR